MSDSGSLAYLTELTLRLAIGASGFPDSIRQRHVTWLAARQRPDGGFAGREGASDPYYTAFALRALWVLGGIDTQIGAAAASFLRGRLGGRESIVDLVSLVFGAAICELSVGAVVIADDDTRWRDNLRQVLESLRCDDGGFAKSPEGKAGSTYQTFLAVLAMQLVERPPEQPEKILDFLRRQSHAEGGFLEIRAAKRAGVNPTAAAIGTLKALGRLDASEHAATAEFLAEMQTDGGGFTANTRIPFADLLSTFTALLTLADLGAVNSAGSAIDADGSSGTDARPSADAVSVDAVSVDAARRYALSMQSPGGGFVGFELDDTADVEYTFYGIATLALCHALQAPS